MKILLFSIFIFLPTFAEAHGKSATVYELWQVTMIGYFLMSFRVKQIYSKVMHYPRMLADWMRNVTWGLHHDQVGSN